MAEKTLLRRQVRKLVRSLGETELATQSLRIFTNFRGLPELSKVSSIAIYAAMTKGEARTDSIVSLCDSASIRCFLPKCYPAPRVNDMEMLLLNHDVIQRAVGQHSEITHEIAVNQQREKQLEKRTSTSLLMEALGRTDSAATSRSGSMASAVEAYNSLPRNKWDIPEHHDSCLPRTTGDKDVDMKRDESTETEDHYYDDIGAGSSNTDPTKVLAFPISNTSPQRALDDKNPQLSRLDLIIVPGLAFDRFGGRLGHGRGFYDKYLERAFKWHLKNGFERPLTVGLSLTEQLMPNGERVPMDELDVPIDIIVFPDGVIRTHET